MNTWESGRESKLLDDIISGRKTIEGRLNRSKFGLYKPGDIIKLRRDIRLPDGKLVDGKPDSARVEVIAIRHYATFLDMVRSEGFRKVIPSAKNVIEAAGEYNKYYSHKDQKQYGVLAIEVRLLS